MLKQCPFCGCLPIIIDMSYGKDSIPDFDIECGTPGCLLEFGIGWHTSEREIVKMWNTRYEE